MALEGRIGPPGGRPAPMRRGTAATVAVRGTITARTLLLVAVACAAARGGAAAADADEEDFGEAVLDEMIDGGGGSLPTQHEHDEVCEHDTFSGCAALQKSSAESAPVPVISADFVPKVDGCSSSSIWSISQQDSVYDFTNCCNDHGARVAAALSPRAARRRRRRALRRPHPAA